MFLGTNVLMIMVMNELLAFTASMFSSVIDLNCTIVSHSLGGAHTTFLGHLAHFFFFFVGRMVSVSQPGRFSRCFVSQLSMASFWGLV
ncbi:hypothetical protein QBC32DRAFT_340169 [Pseudoneurospora amorphoporcata]|uniref:Uncharacterized protein n=1 Tax=Pseudoneurospora amorphoporcata TaxID=241081 RepID=A0AAN6NW25_9PEZI|nr:hypothetical protein QBC32DRAFT_340169 [Pseudoneurospora amorphoporcata]